MIPPHELVGQSTAIDRSHSQRNHNGDSGQLSPLTGFTASQGRASEEGAYHLGHIGDGRGGSVCIATTTYSRYA